MNTSFGACFCMVVVILIISVIAFVIIQLPPGDYLTSVIANMNLMGIPITENFIESLERQFGFNQPLYRQYLTWVGNIIFRFDFGKSFSQGRAEDSFPRAPGLVPLWWKTVCRGSMCGTVTYPLT